MLIVFFDIKGVIMENCGGNSEPTTLQKRISNFVRKGQKKDVAHVGKWFLLHQDNKGAHIVLSVK